MKNLTARFSTLSGNLNRAHSAKVPLLIILLAAIMVFPLASCQQEPDPDKDDTPIAYTVIQLGGTDNQADSTGISFSFNKSVNNLTDSDITVNGSASKGSGALSGSGKTWTLPITVNAAGTVNVSITKAGIEAVTKSVIVFKQGQTAPEYWSIAWNLNGGTAGSGTYPTQVEKGAVLAKPSPDPTKANNTFGGWYSDSGLTQAYNFASPVTANLNLYTKWETGQINPGGSGTITYTVIQNGGVDGQADSTGIVFIFSRSVDSLNLTTSDITVNGAALKSSAALTGSGTSRTLPITVTAGGAATVTIAQTSVETETKNVIVYRAGQPVSGTPGLAYELLNNDTYRVRKGAVTGGVVIIPTNYNGKLVTEIGSIYTSTDASFYNTSITAIYIPESVTSIGQCAFYNCASLTRITIPASVTIISAFVFTGCTSLSSITIPASVTTIDNHVFYGWTSAQTIYVPFAQGSRPSGWDSMWNQGCDATIVYQ